jgi:hypothetical protein
MASLILTHLGDSCPSYIQDCVYQFRLFNPSTPLYLILEPVHKSNIFWTGLEKAHGVKLIYSDTLTKTSHHFEFQTSYADDVKFRRGYWKHVRERFFYIEELMMKEGLRDVISMEYDVMVYGQFSKILPTLQSGAQTLRFVMDNSVRGHPAFLYIPSVEELNKFTVFLAGIQGMPYEDMQSLAFFSKLHAVHHFPVITEERNKSLPIRRSAVGHVESNPSYLSEDSESFGVLFDSLCAGQYLGGIDSRNTGGHKFLNYENETALYRFTEMPFDWRKDTTSGLWQPFLDNRPLFTIHVHSKALMCFLSDRASAPTADYDVGHVFQSLLPN